MMKELVLNSDNNDDEDVVILNDDAATNASDDAVALDASDDSLPKRAHKNKDGTVTLKLIQPVGVKVRDHNGVERDDTYSEFTFRPLNGADMRAINAVKDDMSTIVAFARATTINQAVMNKIFDKLLLSDIVAGNKILEFFMNGGQ